MYVFETGRQTFIFKFMNKQKTERKDYSIFFALEERTLGVEK